MHFMAAADALAVEDSSLTGGPPIVVDFTECEGDEVSLLQCDHSPAFSACPRAAVVCSHDEGMHEGMHETKFMVM